MLAVARTAVAVVAIHAVLSSVNLMAKGDGLNRLVVLLHPNAH